MITVPLATGATFTADERDLTLLDLAHRLLSQRDLHLRVHQGLLRVNTIIELRHLGERMARGVYQRGTPWR